MGTPTWQKIHVEDPQINYTISKLNENGSKFHDGMVEFVKSLSKSQDSNLRLLCEKINFGGFYKYQ
jgi:hypothetical protein